eukprot:m.445849 g.445849  ORF g.445849 m.445849 type:complete len:60 (+) comp19284_c0_seq1:17-196(+)
MGFRIFLFLFHDLSSVKSSPRISRVTASVVVATGAGNDGALDKGQVSEGAVDLRVPNIH